MNGIATVAKSLIGLLYPAQCLACGSGLEALDNAGICPSCRTKIRRNPKPHCKSCGRSIDDRSGLCAECARTKFHFERAWSAYLYEGVLKDLVHLFKYSGRLSLARAFSDLLFDFINENPEILDGIDAITYVPLQAGNLRRRGFNQSKVLGARISARYDIPLLDLLTKSRATRCQNELSREERLDNLKGAFRSRGGNLKEKTLLLIDDVMTTGSTLNECSKTLLGSGAKNVRCLTLARGI